MLAENEPLEFKGAAAVLLSKGSILYKVCDMLTQFIIRTHVMTSKLKYTEICIVNLSFTSQGKEFGSLGAFANAVACDKEQRSTAQYDGWQVVRARGKLFKAYFCC